MPFGDPANNTAAHRKARADSKAENRDRLLLTVTTDGPTKASTQ
jgi:hypothetical protein